MLARYFRQFGLVYGIFTHEVKGIHCILFADLCIYLAWPNVVWFQFPGLPDHCWVYVQYGDRADAHACIDCTFVSDPHWFPHHTNFFGPTYYEQCLRFSLALLTCQSVVVPLREKKLVFVFRVGLSVEIN